jgi:probable rRNA maturation factor
MTRILSIQNRQRIRRLDPALFRIIAQDLLRRELQVRSYEIGLHLVDATEMTRINQQFLQHEGSTDVITFDHSEPRPDPPGRGPLPTQLHGEIFISVPDALAQAREFGTRWPEEILRYVIHGLLHLQGYDDLEPAARRTMKRRENQVLAEALRRHPVKRLERSSLRPDLIQPRRRKLPLRSTGTKRPRPARSA